MLAKVSFRLPEGRVAPAGPGSLIGRAFTADVRIDNGRISEAHALVSLRGGELVALALRGRLRVEGRDVTRVPLRPGLRLELAPDVTLEVDAVELPDTLLALEGPGIPRQVLLGTTSVVLEPRPHLVSGASERAAALVWNDGARWRARVGDQPVRSLRGGDRLEVGGVTLSAVAEARAGADQPDTSPRSSAGAPLRIISRFDSVQLWRAGAASPCLLKGQPARLFSELMSVAGPMRWEALASSLWPGEEPEALRHRLDVTLARLRRTLKDAGIRRDLVTAHRNGQLEVLLYPGDQADECD